MASLIVWWSGCFFSSPYLFIHVLILIPVFHYSFMYILIGFFPLLYLFRWNKLGIPNKYSQDLVFFFLKYHFSCSVLLRVHYYYHPWRRTRIQYFLKLVVISYIPPPQKRNRKENHAHLLFFSAVFQGELALDLLLKVLPSLQCEEEMQTGTPLERRL